MHIQASLRCVGLRWFDGVDNAALCEDEGGKSPNIGELPDVSPQIDIYTVIISCHFYG